MGVSVPMEEGTVRYASAVLEALLREALSDSSFILALRSSNTGHNYMVVVWKEQRSWFRHVTADLLVQQPPAFTNVLAQSRH